MFFCGLLRQLVSGYRRVDLRGLGVNNFKFLFQELYFEAFLMESGLDGLSV